MALIQRYASCTTTTPAKQLLFVLQARRLTAKRSPGGRHGPRSCRSSPQLQRVTPRWRRSLPGCMQLALLKNAMMLHVPLQTQATRGARARISPPLPALERGISQVRRAAAARKASVATLPSITGWRSPRSQNSQTIRNSRSLAALRICRCDLKCNRRRSNLENCCHRSILLRGEGQDLGFKGSPTNACLSGLVPVCQVWCKCLVQVFSQGTLYRACSK